MNNLAARFVTNAGQIIRLLASALVSSVILIGAIGFALLAIAFGGKT